MKFPNPWRYIIHIIPIFSPEGGHGFGVAFLKGVGERFGIN
jgi:hypothetical protein